ncbi:hypothetical protein ACJ41O_011813 [Fusarium nematophilum]
MITLLSPNFVLEEVTEYDLIIASLAWGFTLGIGWLTTWAAVKQTSEVYKRRRFAVFRNAYVWMIWLEILVCLAFGIICFMYLLGAIPPSFAFYFSIQTYKLPPPQSLFGHYRIVQHNLVERGLFKYRNLVRFNMFIIGFSLSMDVLIISMMSLKNTFVYMQFHPLAYIVKLNIEMSMAELIARVARKQGHKGPSDGGYSHSRSNGTHVGERNLTVDDPSQLGDDGQGKGRAWATVTTTVEMHSMKAPTAGDKAKRTFSYNDTDALINLAAPYTGHLGGTQAGAQGPSCRGGSGSLSSYDSTTVDAVAERSDDGRGRMS